MGFLRTFASRFRKPRPLGLVVSPPAYTWTSGGFNGATDTAAHTILASSSSGVKIYATQLLVANAHATVATVIQLNNLDSGNHLYVFAPAVTELPPISFDPPLAFALGQPATFQNLTTGSNTSVSLNGFAS